MSFFSKLFAFIQSIILSIAGLFGGGGATPQNPPTPVSPTAICQFCRSGENRTRKRDRSRNMIHRIKRTDPPSGGSVFMSGVI